LGLGKQTSTPLLFIPLKKTDHTLNPIIKRTKSVSDGF